jgi:hypothetical protein
MSAFGGPNIITDGLVLNLDAGNSKSYPGSGTSWFDKSGFGNNGTLINGPTFNTENGGSIVFDKVDDYVKVTASPILTFGTSDFTFNWWETPLPQTGTIRTFGNIPNRVWAANDWVIGQLNTNTFQFYVNNYNTSTPMFNTSIADSIWQNIAITRLSNTWTLYIDGVSPVSPVSSGVSLDGNIQRDFYIGTSGILSEFWKGNLATTQIYNRALSASEVLQNYNATKGRFGLL